MIKCPRCGAENRTYMNYCHNCGTPLASANLRHFPTASDMTPDDYGVRNETGGDASVKEITTHDDTHTVLDSVQESKAARKRSKE